MNWQTPVTVALGLAAAVYLLRRWWPTWSGLWQRQTAAQAGACGTPTTGSACGSGCGNCGNNKATASKDHRVRIVPRAPH